MSDNKTHWKRLVNCDYIGVYSLPNGGDDLTVTILSVAREQVVGANGKKEECPVARLKNQKPFILNRTNNKSIEKLYGPYIEDWAGKQITLFASTTKLAGDVVECLRVRPFVNVPTKPGIDDDRFAGALNAIKAGTYTAEKLRSAWALTEDQSAALDVFVAQLVSGGGDDNQG